MDKKDLEIQLDPIRGQVMNISRMLPTGAKYYTIASKDVDKKYEERKNQILTNPTSPELYYNRSPRVIIVMDHSVVSQTFKSDIEGNKVVVFNEGAEDEAQATIVAGGVNFGQATEEAMKDALRGQVRIFADGIKTCTKANILNNAELTRVSAERDRLNGIIDSIKSAIASNKKKVEEYQAQVNAFKPEVNLGEGSIVVPVGGAE